MRSTHLFGIQRQGISIIEVLTSMIVAMIGVLGIMIMIPFAVQQSQTGLDRDAATVVARNAFDQFEIRGYRAIDGDGFLNWTGTGLPNSKIPVSTPQVFCIDPLGIMENDPINGLYGLPVSFPFNAFPILPDGTGAFPNSGDLSFASVNLWGPTGPIGLAMARQMFRGQDELSFGDPGTSPASPIADLNAPQQYFDSGTVGALRRQYRGSLSWCAIVVPVKDDYGTAPTSPTGAWKYRMYVLVFKNRPALLDATGDGVMFTAGLDSGANVGLASPLSTVYLDAGTVVEDTPLHKDDWVMLINRAETDDTVAGYPSGILPAEFGFEKQIAFARVVNFANQNGTTLPTITLDGPDFNFGDLSDVAANITSPTYIVHLRNVVSVYERTFVLEGESNWNISF